MAARDAVMILVSRAGWEQREEKGNTNYAIVISSPVWRVTSSVAFLTQRCPPNGYQVLS